MRKPELRKACKQMRHAADNLWGNCKPEDVVNPTLFRSDIEYVLKSLANYLEYGKVYKPQLRSNVQTLLHQLTDEQS